jgi:hypothetical protein
LRERIDIRVGRGGFQKSHNQLAILLESFAVRMGGMLPDVEEASAGSGISPKNPGILEPGLVVEAESGRLHTKPVYFAHW